MSSVSEVFALRNEGRNVYLILDGALADVPRLIYEQDDSPELVQLFRGTQHESALEVSPCLIAPSSASRIWENESLWRHIGVIAVSEHDFNTVVEHFRSLLTVTLDGSSQAYFRFYSPTMLSGLLAILSEQERSVFSGPISQWGYWDEWIGWGSVAVESEIDVFLRDEGWFRISELHLAALSQRGKVRFQKRLLRYLALPESQDNLKIIEDLCLQAQSFDIHSEAGMASYCELAITHGKRINDRSISAVLTDAGLTEGERLRQVDQLLAYGGA